MCFSRPLRFGFCLCLRYFLAYLDKLHLGTLLASALGPFSGLMCPPGCKNKSEHSFLFLSQRRMLKSLPESSSSSYVWPALSPQDLITSYMETFCFRDKFSLIHPRWSLNLHMVEDNNFVCLFSPEHNLGREAKTKTERFTRNYNPSVL